MPDRKRILERLGLEGYAAKAYLALLETASASAKEVAERAGIPKGRIYEVLEHLHRQGVVVLQPEMPKRYRAVPLPELFDRLVRSQSAELETLKAERSMVLEAFAPPPADATEAPGDVLVLREHDLILDRAMQALGKAQKDVLLVGDGTCAQRLQQWDEVVRASLRRGVKWRLLVPSEEAHRAAVEEARGWGVEVRHRASDDAAAVLLLDSERLVLFQGPALPRARGDPSAYLFDVPAVARTVRSAMEQLWAEAAHVDGGSPVAGAATGTPSPEGRARLATTAPRVTVQTRAKRPNREGPRSL